MHVLYHTRVQCQQPEVKTTDGEARMATYVCIVIDLQQQAAHNGMKYGRWSSGSGSKGHAYMALINECHYRAPSLPLADFV